MAKKTSQTGYIKKGHGNRIGSKIAVATGSGGCPVKGKRYDIYYIGPVYGRGFCVQVVDVEAGTKHEVNEKFFDWSLPWYETGENDPVDMKYRQAMKYERIGL